MVCPIQCPVSYSDIVNEVRGVGGGRVPTRNNPVGPIFRLFFIFLYPKGCSKPQCKWSCAKQFAFLRIERTTIRISNFIFNCISPFGNAICQCIGRICAICLCIRGRNRINRIVFDTNQSGTGRNGALLCKLRIIRFIHYGHKGGFQRTRLIRI